MAHYSASSWSFIQRGDQGPIKVRRSGRKVLVRLDGTAIITVCLLTGRFRLLFWGMEKPTLQLCNAYNRFFHLSGAKRYSVEIRLRKAYLIDSIRKTKQEIPEHGLTSRLPTKCVFNILQHLGNYWNFSEWIEEYISEQEQARQEAAGAINNSEPVEVRAEIPF